MMRSVFDGKALSSVIFQELVRDIKGFQDTFRVTSYPKLAYVYMGNNSSVLTYLSIKHKACEKLGIQAQGFYFPEDTPADLVKQTISNLNKDLTVNGILVQLPLAKSVNEQEIIDSVCIEKDVDGLHSMNIAKIALRSQNPLFFPCTPKGCIEILNRNGVKICGKNAVIIGRSNLAGMTLALMLQKMNATVTICHSFTEDLGRFTRNADILAVAVGKPFFIKEDMVKDGAALLDIGINRVDGRIVGDVHPDVQGKAGFFTPVPGGVGPLTVAMLMKNVVEAWKRQHR